MKKSEYDTLLSYIKDPYQGYLSQRSGESHKNIDEDEIKAVKRELDSMGYRLYVGDGGELEPEFILRSCEECRKSIENIGKLPDLIYCDEDRRTNVYQDPFFKPDFSPDTLESFFYIGGAFLIRSGAGDDFERTLRSQDYLNIGGTVLSGFVNNRKGYFAVHIPEVLFHSASDADYSYPEGARPRMIYPEKGSGDMSKAKVRCVILSRDNPKQLFECLDSFIDNADVSMEYVVVDNGSDEMNKELIKSGLDKRRAKYIYNPDRFIYSKLCNIGAKSGNDKYDFLLLINDDVILPGGTEGFPSLLMRKANQDHVGAVGVKLYYPEPQDGDVYEIKQPMKIQHAGIALTEEGPAHKLAKFNDDITYEHGRNRGNWDVMAVTGACMLVNRDKFFSVGGFDERLHISYTDVDLCMDLWERGLYNVVMNDMALLHFESLTRGEDTAGREKAERLRRERQIFYEKHSRLLAEGDRFYNPNLKRKGPAYDPDYDFPWEEETVSMPLHDAETGRIIDSAALMGSIDEFSFKASSFEGKKDVYEILGWCIMHGKDMLKYEPALLVRREGEKRVYRATRFYREDLGTVFPKEKNVLLSGFICRLDASLVKDLKREELMPALMREGFFTGKQEVFAMKPE